MGNSLTGTPQGCLSGFQLLSVTLGEGQAAMAVDLAKRFSSHLWFWYLRDNLTIAYHSLARLFVEPSFVEMNFKSDAR